jgi:hypothetical protein
VVAKMEQVGASGQGYSLGLPVSYVQVSRGLKPCKSYQYIGERVLSVEFGVNRRNSGQKCSEEALSLNNEVFWFNYGSEPFWTQREYQPTYTFGLRWDLQYEK